MARTAIERQTIPVDGFDLSAATFETMATGSGNGVEFPHNTGDIIVLENNAGGPATYTIVVNQPAQYDDHGITVPDITEVVAVGDQTLYRVAGIMKQGDGNVYVDCDVAADILVLDV